MATIMATRPVNPQTMLLNPYGGQQPLVAVKDIPAVGRKLRRPKHRFALETRPWQIAPFMIAPVLPGETLKNALLQSRVVSDPVKQKLVGWFAEYYLFYVKLSDLDDWESLSAMLVQNVALTGLVTAASAPHYYRGDGVNFTKLCIDRVVDEYFRADGEAVDISSIDGLPLAAIDVADYTQSVVVDGTTDDTGENLPGENPGLPDHMSAFADHYAHWQAMRDMQLVDATFEDWLQMMGVSVPEEHKASSRRPELLRYIRQWSYPSNTINPTDGMASSALSWSIAERADKDRFFREPGFIIGVTVKRPKVYKANIESAGAHYLDIPFAWLPAVLRDDPYTSLREFAQDKGPLAATVASSYWLDMNDLYQHGDQFIYTPSSGRDADVNAIALPTAAFEGDYATEAMADALFTEAAGGYKYVREDGVCDLRILSAHSREDHSL